MDKKLKQFFQPGINLCVQFIYVSIIYRMLDVDKSHLDVTWVSQSLYSGPLSNPDFFLSLIAGRIRQVVLYQLHYQIHCNFLLEKCENLHKNNSVFVILNFNATLTNDVVNFEQPAPGLQKIAGFVTSCFGVLPIGHLMTSSLSRISCNCFNLQFIFFSKSQINYPKYFVSD